MDAFLQEISRKLQEESAALTRFVETEHKEMTARTYECMAACYRRSESIDECQTCASGCNTGVLQFQQDLDAHIKTIQSNFQGCMQACALKIVQNDGEELKACVSVCHEVTIQSFTASQAFIKELVAKYQS